MRWDLKIAALLIGALVISITSCFAAQMNFTYDKNGNLVTGDGFYRTYNALNQLWRIYNGSNATGALLQEFVYHPTEERVLSKKIYYSNGTLQETVIYFSQNLVRTINSSGTFDTRFVRQDGQLIAQQDFAGRKLYIIGDNKGSSIVVTNNSGAVVENNSYSPFGQRLTNSIVRYGYEGKEQDSVIGDIDFSARRYATNFAIFEQPDTLLHINFNPQYLNRYTFEINNPYKFVDPTGRKVDSYAEFPIYQTIDKGNIVINQLVGYRIQYVLDGKSHALFLTAAADAALHAKVSRILATTYGQISAGPGAWNEFAVSELEAIQGRSYDPRSLLQKIVQSKFVSAIAIGASTLAGSLGGPGTGAATGGGLAYNIGLFNEEYRSATSGKSFNLIRPATDGAVGAVGGKAVKGAVEVVVGEQGENLVADAAYDYTADQIYEHSQDAASEHDGGSTS